MSLDTFKTQTTLKVGGKNYQYYSLPALEKAGVGPVSALPFSLKVLLENLLRTEDNIKVTPEDIRFLANWDPKATPDHEIAFTVARVLLQDFTGVPCVVDLAAMRDALKKLGGDPAKVNPLQPVDLVIDHSVQVDEYGTEAAFHLNVEKEFERNRERYEFLRWGQNALTNFSCVPPGTGICHQVNIEYLAKVVQVQDGVALCDTLVGTDSHTTMVNGLGVVGWGVGGIEAEASMLGQPISMLVPEVIGFELVGDLPAGATATDLVLTATNLLRKKGVVGKFVEFFGDGLKCLSLADRATIANMAPEYGATIGFFPVDEKTMEYLRLTGRPEEHVQLVEAYCKAQGLFRVAGAPAPKFTDTLKLDLGIVVPSLAGPKRPQDRVSLTDVKSSWQKTLAEMVPDESKRHEKVSVQNGKSFDLTNGDVVIAAITSCTNTSNPAVMIAAGLVARKAAARGIKPKPWVKTSLAPGSRVVTQYLEAAGLQKDLDAVGFNLVGYGCTTCIGNSGPLPDAISKAINSHSLVAAAVLSGNRNFEGRVNADVKANYLASPPLVVAYALAGSVDVDISKDALGKDKNGADVFLKDIWPTPEELANAVRDFVRREMFTTEYANVFNGDEMWRALNVPKGSIYSWQPDSTYVRLPPYFEGMKMEPSPVKDIAGARVLMKLGDSVTTDHISPAGSISKKSPAAAYLVANGVQPADFNSYGARRGNHEVMVRGTFANTRIRNQMAPGTEGGLSRHIPTGEVASVYDVAMKYISSGTPLIVLAGKEYGTGSSRDWAAKGTALLGVRAVIAETFERIHRSNLIGMGVLPLQYPDGQSAASLGLTGDEQFDITGIAKEVKPRMVVDVIATDASGARKTFKALVRIDTPNEVDYYKHGGIMLYVLRQLAKS